VVYVQVPGCVAMVQQWIEGMGAFVKALDPNHMVTVGAVSVLRLLPAFPLLQTPDHPFIIATHI